MPSTEGLDAVLRDMGPALRRISLAYGADPADAEDLYQNICYAIWRALPSFRGDAALRTFIWRIAHNRGLSHRARRPPPDRQLPLLDDTPDPAPSAEHLLATRQLHEQLLTAVRSLSDAQCEVVLLALEGLSHAEIGAVLGLTENAVAVRLNRAKNSLKQRLDPKAFDR
jgi:RNA polymerase sigma-70 factor, ECF subfamily